MVKWDHGPEGVVKIGYRLRRCGEIGSRFERCCGNQMAVAQVCWNQITIWKVLRKSDSGYTGVVKWDRDLEGVTITRYRFRRRSRNEITTSSCGTLVTNTADFRPSQKFRKIILTPPIIMSILCIDYIYSSGGVMHVDLWFNNPALLCRQNAL